MHLFHGHHYCGLVKWMFSIFHKADKFGAVLLLKLSGISGTRFSAFLWTACFIACQTGNLDRVFSESTLQKSDISLYIIAGQSSIQLFAGLSWHWEMSVVLPGFIVDNKAHSSLIALLGMHVVISEQLIILAEVITLLLLILTEHAYLFSHSVNYMVTSIIDDQLRALNKDFHCASGCRGEFQGSITDIRQRHQKLSKSVQNANQFMVMSNVAGFCCQIVNIILILYCAIFFLNETVGQDVNSIIKYTFWLVASFCAVAYFFLASGYQPSLKRLSRNCTYVLFGVKP